MGDSIMSPLGKALGKSLASRAIHIAHIIMLILLPLLVFAPFPSVAHECLYPIPRHVNRRFTHCDLLHFLIAQFVPDECHPFIQCPHLAYIRARHLRQLQKMDL